MAAGLRTFAILCALILGASVTVVSCAAPEDIPGPPAVVDVALDEFYFGYDDRIPPGRVVFEVANRGRLKHELVLLRLPDDFPPIDEQLHSDERRPLPTLALLPELEPGAEGSFAVDLVAGRYAMLCGVQEEGDAVPHALKGMSSEFVVR